MATKSFNQVGSFALGACWLFAGPFCFAISHPSFGHALLIAASVWIDRFIVVFDLMAMKWVNFGARYKVVLK